MSGYELPLAIEVNGIEHPITNKGDFRMILDCFGLLNDKNIPEIFYCADLMKIFYEEINRDEDINVVFGDHVKEAVEKMKNFFNCNQLDVGEKMNLNLIDWEQDEQLICSAINLQARTEIRSAPYMHWFTFAGYFLSIDGGAFATVMSLRYKRATGKSLEKHEREFIRNNPQYFVTKEELAEQEAEREWFKSVWNKE